MKIGYVIIGFLFLILFAGIPLLFIGDLKFDKTLYTNEYLKMAASIFTIVFSLLLTLYLENIRDKKKVINELIEYIQEHQIFLCNEIKKKLDTADTNLSLTRVEKVQLGASWSRLEQTSNSVFDVERYLETIDQISIINYQNSFLLPRCSNIVTEIIEEEELINIKENEDYEILVEFIRERKSILEDIVRSLKNKNNK